jgi:two-component sensor histidine kinase
MADNQSKPHPAHDADFSALADFPFKSCADPLESAPGEAGIFWKRVMRAACGTSSMAVLAWDFRSGEFQCPESFRERLGLPEGAVFSKMLAVEDRPVFFNAVNRALESPPIDVGRIRWILPDKSARVIAIHDAELERDESGATARLLVLVRDLTKADDALQAVRKIQQNAKEQVAATLTLLQEMNHRVKNNLQIVCSLIQSHSDSLDDGDARTSFRTIETRVRTIARLHDMLSSGFGSLEAAAILRELASLVAQTGALSVGRLELDLQVGGAELDAAQAMPFAMAAHELLMNSLLHGIPGTPVAVQLRGLGDGSLRLTIRNSCRSAPANSTPGLGLEIVRALCKQLRAVFHSEFAWNEAACHLVLPPGKGVRNG